MIKISEYKKEKGVLIKFMEELQDYLIQIDPMKRMQRLPEYGKLYVANLLEQVKEADGIIYIASHENNPVGMIAGVIQKSSKEDEVESITSTTGGILELIVQKEYRGKNIGSLLMKKMEEYFQNKNCDVICVEVFAPNIKTHDFYEKFGYEDRLVTMIKKI